MTAVETAPDLRHARVFVSRARRRGVRRALAGGPRSPRTACCSASSPRELRLKHTPTLEFVYDDTAERGMRIARADSTEEAEAER